jgi:hypothetical protein
MHGVKWRRAQGAGFADLISSRSIISVGFISLAALITLLPTLFNRYLFLDETWYTGREQTVGHGPWATLGRPLLRPVMLLTEHLEKFLGLGAIYIYRVDAIILLAITGALVFGWLRRFYISDLNAMLYAVGLISLPAFQVLAATSHQLLVAPIATLLAGHLICPMLTGVVTRRDGIYRAAGGTALCFVALCTYQVSVLLLLAMLLLPMLQTSRRDVHRCVALGLTYAGLAVITAVYYAVWKLLYVAPANGGGAAYDPNGAALSSVISGLQGFMTGPIHQVANLWYVEDLAPSPFFYVSVSAVLLAAGRLLYAERLFGMLKIVVAIGTLLVCDIFRLAASHPPTYTTLHALTTAWWLLFIWSVDSIFGRGLLAKGAAVATAIIGLVCATWTTDVYILDHNAAQFSAIEEAMLAKPNFQEARIIGTKDNFSQLYEYGWTSGALTLYTFSMAHFIATRHFGWNPNAKIHVSNVADQEPAKDDCEKPDLAIRLPSPTNRCAGLACSLSEAQIDSIDWKTCKVDTAAN